MHQRIPDANQTSAHALDPCFMEESYELGMARNDQASCQLGNSDEPQNFLPIQDLLPWGEASPNHRLVRPLPETMDLDH